MNSLVEQAGECGNGGCSRRVTQRSAFTLIELLVVVAIIMVLVGITLKVSGVVTRRSAYVKTLQVIEQVKSALGEYYSAFGAYPPSDKATPRNVDPNPNNCTTVDYVEVPTNMVGLYPSVSNWHVSTGLVYYLAYTTDSKQWAQFMNNPTIITDGQPPFVAQYSGGYTPTYTNASHAILDGWNNRLRYWCEAGIYTNGNNQVCTNNYQSYRIWSCGPNGVDEGGTNDDIGVQWTE